MCLAEKLKAQLRLKCEIFLRNLVINVQSAAMC
jgi:hypothetical protein